MSVEELSILCGLPSQFLNKFKNKYSEGFIRKVLGECFPPTMSLEILKQIKDED